MEALEPDGIAHIADRRWRPPPPARRRAATTQTVLDLRRQPPRVDAVRPVRPEPRADRAPARRGGEHARQPRHHRRLARRACEQARRVLEGLYEQLKRGHDLSPRRRRRRHPAQAIAQGSLFDCDPSVAAAGLRGDQPAQAAGARPHRRAGRLYPRAQAPRAGLRRQGRPAPARPGSRSRMRSRCSSARRSTASSCRARRSRPASGSAFCPATCARRSIPICARSTTRCTT